MEKWSYLDLRWAIDADCVYFSCNKVDFHTISTLFPQVKDKGFNKEYQYINYDFWIKIDVETLDTSKLQEILEIVLDSLGDMGWEAYSVERWTYHFKRKSG